MGARASAGTRSLHCADDAMQPQWLRLVGQVRASVCRSDARQVLAHLKLTVGLRAD
jgi:hypothetical protein